jgi:hypothetical protein
MAKMGLFKFFKERQERKRREEWERFKGEGDRRDESLERKRMMQIGRPKALALLEKLTERAKK